MTKRVDKTPKKPCPTCDAWSCSCAKEDEKAHPLEGTSAALHSRDAVDAILRKWGMCNGQL
jgi:hypothetical protein